MPFRRTQLFAAVAASVVLAACQDQGPGSLSDPSAMSSELAAVNSAFAGSAFQSYSELAPMITPTAGGALARAATIVEGSTPELKREPSYLRGTNRLNSWRRLVPDVAQLTSGPIIPDTVLGQVFTWDVDTDTYVATATDGPSNGVRFMLYNVNSITRQPVEPLVEVGYVDLMDESVGNTLRLHIQVKGVGGSPTYLDYTATLTATANTFTATVNGSLSNGLAGVNLKTLAFQMSFHVNATSVTANASFDLNDPVIGVDVYQRLTVSNNAIRVTVDFRVQRPGELVRVAGTVALAAVGDELRVQGNMVVTVNGGVFARLHTTGEAEQWTKHDGTSLTAAELQALNDLFAAMERFFDFLSDLVDPVDELAA